MIATELPTFDINYTLINVICFETKMILLELTIGIQITHLRLVLIIKP
jgi:hypothetical protein